MCVHSCNTLILAEVQLASPSMLNPPHLFLAPVIHLFHIIKAFDQLGNCTLHMMFFFSESPFHMWHFLTLKWA